MEKEGYEPKKVMAWAVAHMDAWEVVCGLRNTSTEANAKLAEMLREAELFELSEMMTMRAYQMTLDTWRAEGKGDWIL